MIINILTLIILPIIFAFCYRARGGAIVLNSTTLARLVFWILPVTIIMTVFALTHGYPFWLGLISGAIGFGFLCIGHGFAENDDTISFEEMGLIQFTRAASIFLPFAFFAFPPYVVFIALLAYPTSLISYKYFANNGKSLTLFGIEWCVPNDSSWEELFIGAVNGLMFAVALVA